MFRQVSNKESCQRKKITNAHPLMALQHSYLILLTTTSEWHASLHFNISTISSDASLISSFGWLHIGCISLLYKVIMQQFLVQSNISRRENHMVTWVIFLQWLSSGSHDFPATCPWAWPPKYRPVHLHLPLLVCLLDRYQHLFKYGRIS